MRRSGRTILCLSLAATCGALAARSSAEEPSLARRLDAQRAVLRQLQTDLVQVQEEATSHRRVEQDAAHRLVEASNRASLIAHALGEYARAESALGRDLAIASAREARLHRDIERREETVARRVRVLYMRGRMHPFRRALLASSLTHWLAARQYFATLNRRDEIDIEHLQHDRRDADSLKIIYREQRAMIETLAVDQRWQREKLLVAQREAERLLAAAKRNRQLAERAAAELEEQTQASQEKIADYLAALPRSDATGENRFGRGTPPLPTPDLAAEKGRLPWPVRGQVTGRFGRHRDAATRTWTRNRGIDIRVRRGSQVAAVADGQAVRVDWIRGYGTFIIISHGRNYYTLYAHLGAVTVRRDDQVRRGQAIGVSGDSGTLSEAKVHFELLSGHEALDPLEWLARKAGPS